MLVVGWDVSYRSTSIVPWVETIRRPIHHVEGCGPPRGAELNVCNRYCNDGILQYVDELGN